MVHFFTISVYVNNKDADQPVHPHSLIRIFVVHLDSITSVDTSYRYSKFEDAS